MRCHLLVAVVLVVHSWYGCYPEIESHLLLFSQFWLAVHHFFPFVLFSV